ncbi:MAG: ABC transporter ATP-binding protein [Emcibacteraceae bacterium]|nr:ABC transporter ATP-binding protein [Emcibacteraceae bacterium]
MNNLLVNIKDLTIGFPNGGEIFNAVHHVNLEIKAGEVFALVGESGSGKTLVSKAILNLLPDTALIRSGSIEISGEDILSYSPLELRSYRGKKVGMVFQEPLTSLNPALSIGMQLSEGLKIHSDLTSAEVKNECIKMLNRVYMPNPEEALKKYPHEFSGGMRQRIMLASVMLLKPDLLIADEPTTALDVIVQKEVLDLMMEIVSEEGIGLMLITHDLAIVGEYANRIAVMEKGRIVETGNVEEIVKNPSHPYTKKLFSSVPGNARQEKPRYEDTEPKPPIVNAQNIEVTFPIKKGLFTPDQKFKAVKDVSIKISPGEIVALVGESGSGKSTLGRALLKLVDTSSGSIEVLGTDITNLSDGDIKDMRQNMQLIFQDPFSSLDPRMRVEAIVSEPLRHMNNVSKPEKKQIVKSTLVEVGLGNEFIDRYPHELSGGQRQRVCIARSIIMKPDFIVADEPVAALDVTVQKQILELFSELQKKRGFSCLFISHDLAVVSDVSSRIMVMYHGYIVEEGQTNKIFANPVHPYTRALLQAAPKLPGHDVSLPDLTTEILPDNLTFLSTENIKDDSSQLKRQFLYDLGDGHKVAVLPTER